MEKDFIENKTFDTVDFKEQPLPLAEYENCIFIHCDFYNTDLSKFVFADCTFTDCNLSMAGLVKTALREVMFTGCKMLGLHFENCNEFGFAVGFENCILNHASFYKTRCKNTRFTNVQLLETDFTECDLSTAVFSNCDLAGATFENTILEKADLTTAFNYSINPSVNKIKKASFSLPAVTGLLDHLDIEIVN